MRRFAYVLLALIWIAGIWIWFHGRPDAPAPKPLAPSVPALEEESTTVAKLDAAETPRKPPITRQRRPIPSARAEEPVTVLHVRSSVGLPLIEVEGRVADG